MEGINKWFGVMGEYSAPELHLEPNSLEYCKETAVNKMHKMPSCCRGLFASSGKKMEAAHFVQLLLLWANSDGHSLRSRYKSITLINLGASPAFFFCYFLPPHLFLLYLFSFPPSQETCSIGSEVANSSPQSRINASGLEICRAFSWTTAHMTFNYVVLY